MIEPVVDMLGTIQFKNYRRARITGLELSSEAWTPGRHFGATIALTWMNPQDIHLHETLPYRPKRTLDAGLNFSWKGFSASAEYRYASRVDKVWLDPLDPRVPLKLLHLRVQQRIGVFTLQVMLNNALNYQYAQIERRMGEIRNLSVALLTDLGI
jgi:outer membrane cobalamin receptor